MNYWLIKSEPSKYSWDQLVQEKTTMWNGVRNYAARNNLRAMKKGDQLLYYHSNEGLAIVGVAEVTKEFYQDPTTDNTNWVVVDIKPIKELKNAVPLSLIKATGALANMALVKLSRLSVSPVTTDEWTTVLNMSETKKDR